MTNWARAFLSPSTLTKKSGSDMNMNEYTAEPYAADREGVESEVGRPITDEEWTYFVNELFGALDYYYNHNFTLLCDDIRNGTMDIDEDEES